MRRQLFRYHKWYRNSCLLIFCSHLCFVTLFFSDLGLPAQRILFNFLQPTSCLLRPISTASPLISTLFHLIAAKGSDHSSIFQCEDCMSKFFSQQRAVMSDGQRGLVVGVVLLERPCLEQPTFWVFQGPLC